METREEKSCGVVLFHQNQGHRSYLLLHYIGGHWDLPKGHVEPAETEHQTAHRELIEETGIEKIEFIDNFRQIIKYSFTWKGVLINKTVVFFLASTTNDQVQLSHEHQGAQWLPFDQALSALTFDNAKELLIKAENFLKSRQ